MIEISEDRSLDALLSRERTGTVRIGRAEFSSSPFPYSLLRPCAQTRRLLLAHECLCVNASIYVYTHVRGGREKKIDPLGRGCVCRAESWPPRAGSTCRERARSSHQGGRYEGIKPIWPTGGSQSKGQMWRRLQSHACERDDHDTACGTPARKREETSRETADRIYTYTHNTYIYSLFMVQHGDRLAYRL